MKHKQINILGQEYVLTYATEDEKPKLKYAEANGLAELYSKELIVNQSILDDADPGAFDRTDLFVEKVIRHEIIHAFFHEAGLTTYTNDEVLVDWLALQICKMYKVMSDVGATTEETSTEIENILENILTRGAIL